MDKAKALELIRNALQLKGREDGSDTSALKALADAILHDGDIEAAILATDRARRARRANDADH